MLLEIHIILAFVSAVSLDLSRTFDPKYQQWGQSPHQLNAIKLSSVSQTLLYPQLTEDLIKMQVLIEQTKGGPEILHF